MKRLILFRHAKSSWTDASLADHDRPLAQRGVEAGVRMNRYLQESGLRPDSVWVSSAARAQATCDAVESALGNADITTFPEIYAAGPLEQIDMIGAADDSVNTLMIIGHNPTMEETALSLLSKDQLDTDMGRDMARKFPTAALAVIDLPVDHWRDVVTGKGTLERFIKPKSLQNT